METEQIIRQSIEDAGLTDTVDDTPDTTLEVTDTDTADPVETAVSEQNATDDNAEDNQPPAVDPEEAARRKNPGRIPYHRHEAILKKQRDEAAKALEDTRKEAETLKQQYAAYAAPEFQSFVQSLQLMETDPEKFLDAVASVDPRYAKLLQAKRQAEATATTVEPDLTFQDGSKAYSPEAFDRFLASKLQAQQAQIEQSLSERFGPMESAFRQAEHRNRALHTVRQKVEEAQTWPGFTLHQDDIVKAMNADPSLSLDVAYRNVVFGKLAASKDQQRAALIAEADAKAKASQARPSKAGAPISGTPRTTEDIIRQSMKDKGLA